MRTEPNTRLHGVRRLLPGSLLLAMLAAGFCARLHAADASRVFSTISPSTVVVEDVDSQGSGVVLNDQGLILTNFHVVAAGIDLKVKAKVQIDGKVRTVEIDNVKLLKVHPTYDAALLQATPPQGGRFLPAALFPRSESLDTGMRCFAVGNPQGQSLDMTITEGLVSAPVRNIEGLDYVQISAQINPGNSGGPVVDERGKVFGITTWKMTEAEGIGFAIPIQNLSPQDFVQPQDKKPNLDQAGEANDAGMKYYQLAQDATGQDRDILLAESAECYHICIQANPADPAPLQNLCTLSHELGNDTLGNKYAEAAYKLDPDNPKSCHLLGSQEVAASPQDPAVKAKWIENWFRVLSKDGKKSDQSACASDIAVAMLNDGKYLPGAYMLQWSDVLDTDGEDTTWKDQNSPRWTALGKVLSQDQIDQIKEFREGFSKAEFDALAAGKPLESLRASPAESGGGAGLSAATPAPVVLPAFTAAQRQAVIAAAAAIYEPQVKPLPSDGIEVPLPERPGRVILANAGWQLVMTFPDLAKLGVFNLASGKMDGFIDCDDGDVQIASGGALLAVYLPHSQTLDLYDLRSLRKIESKPNVSTLPVKYMGMGLLNPTRIFVLRFDSSAPRDHALAPAIISVPSLELKDLTVTKQDLDDTLPAFLSTGADDSIEGAMNDEGTLCVTRSHALFNRFTWGSIRGDGSIKVSHGDIIPGDPGTPYFTGGMDMIVTRTGIFGPKGGNQYAAANQSFQLRSLAPIAGYPGYVELGMLDSAPLFRVCALPNMESLIELPVSRQRFANVYSGALLPMFASAPADRVASVLSQSVLLFPLGMKGRNVTAEFAQPGRRYTRALKLPDGSAVAVQSGPDGLVYDDKSQSLIWDVPVSTRRPQLVRVILLLTAADGKQTYDVEKISVP